MKIAFIIFSYLFILNSTAEAQADAYTGKWKMEYSGDRSSPPILMELIIASPERSILYPARLTLSCDSFFASYELLLVKKNSRQLGIGKHKVPLVEGPFTMGSATILLNGTFDLSRDNKGVPYLSAGRIPAKNYGVDFPQFQELNKADKNTANSLYTFLKNAEIKLKKENGYDTAVFKNYAAQLPLQHGYFGILDTVRVTTREGILNFKGNKKTANGMVSVMLNGKTVLDQVYLSQNKPVEEIFLDTGLNILVFFADDYGNTPATTGALNAVFGKNVLNLDFGHKKDVAATFIVAKIYYDAGKEIEEDNEFQRNIVTQFLENNMRNDVNIYRYPDKDRKVLFKNDSAKAVAEQTLLRDVKLVGNIEARWQQIILAFWDDAVEDGDSISLSINGKWIVQGLAVKKKPQFIYVTLEPGQNNITFIADNLGSIIPNTSILEIIDGKQRKSFMIDTDLNKNNLVKIFYEYKP